MLKTLARLDSTKSKPQPPTTLPPPRQEPPTSSSIPSAGKGDRSFSGNSSFAGRNNSSPAKLRSPNAPKRVTNGPDNYQTRVTSTRNGLSHFEIRDAEIRHTNGLGQEIWKIRPQFPDDAIPNGLRLGDKHVYVRDSDGKIHKLDRQTGELLGKASP